MFSKIQPSLQSLRVLNETHYKGAAIGECLSTAYRIKEDDDADTLMKETAKLRKIITKRGTLEILIPLCCTTTPVRYLKFRITLKGFSSKALAKRLKELVKVEF